MRFLIIFSFRCWASLLVVFFLSITIVVGQDKTVSVYQDERETSDRNNVTLAPDFFVPAGKTVRIFTCFRFTEPFVFSGTTSTDQNYVSTKVFKVPGVNESNLNAARQSSEVNQSIAYFDG
jgi:hypothetical protein